MGNERADDQPEHDPYARRPGYVTNASGRTDQVTTAAALGVGAGLVTSFVLGFFQAVEWGTWSVSVLVGVIVWLLLRARQRRRDRSEGRSPDAVAQARDRAIADANGGRRFFVAPNPVVVIVMGGIFLALGLLSLVPGGELSVHRLIVSTILVVCAAFFIVQGIGTLVVRRRADPTRSR